MIEGDLKRGDDIWDYQIESYSRILEMPRFAHGQVSGGGENIIILTWDDGDGVQREARMLRGRARRFFRTRKEAMDAAYAQCVYKSEDAKKRAVQYSRLADLILESTIEAKLNP